jgi:hypothetical protein
MQTLVQLAGKRGFVQAFLGRPFSMFGKSDLVGKGAPTIAATEEFWRVAGKGPFTSENVINLQTAEASF